MKNLIAMLALLTACDSRGTTTEGVDVSSPAEREHVVRKKLGVLFPTGSFSVEGSRNEVLIVGTNRGCNRGILQELYFDGVRTYLREYGFVIFRCPVGEEMMMAPWK